MRLDKGQSLTPICQVFCVHAGEVDGDIQQRVGDHLFHDARRVDARIFELRLLELLVRRDDDVGDCSDGASNHAPLERQRKHRVWHEESKQNVPDEILALCEADSFADEACKRQRYLRRFGSIEDSQNRPCRLSRSQVQVAAQ